MITLRSSGVTKYFTHNTLNISRTYLSIKSLQCYEMTRRYRPLFAGFTFDLPCLPSLSELQMCTDKGTARILNYGIPKLAMLTLRVHYEPLNSN